MFSLPSKPTLKVRIARGPVSLAPPVVAGDSLFVGCEDTEILRLGFPRLDPVWRIPASGYSVDSVVDDTLVLVEMGTQQYRGVHLTGESKWTLEPQAGSTPWIRWGHRIFCNNPGIFVADVRVGKVVEHHEVGGCQIRAGGLIDSDLYLYTTEDEPDVVRMYDLCEHRILWSKNLRAAVSFTYKVGDPFVGVISGSAWEGVLASKSQGHIFGLARADGALRWHKPLILANAFGLHQGEIYAWTSPPDGDDRLVRVDELTGQVLYDRPLKSYGGDLAASYLPTKPCMADEYMAFGTRTGLLAIFRLSDGELVWSYQHKAEVYQPVLSGNRLLVAAADGQLLMFDGERYG